MPLLWKGKERILGQARRKAKGTKEVKVRPTRIQMQKGQVWDHIGSKTKFSETLVKTCKNNHFGCDCKQKPTHDAKEKTPGNKDGQGDKSGKKNDGKCKGKGDGKNEVGKANVALRLSLKLGHCGMVRAMSLDAPPRHGRHLSSSGDPR